MEGIQKHQNGAEGDHRAEDQLIFSLLDVDALQERVDARKVVCQIVESIL